jgi:hypothetical protein
MPLAAHRVAREEKLAPWPPADPRHPSIACGNRAAPLVPASPRRLRPPARERPDREGARRDEPLPRDLSVATAASNGDASHLGNGLMRRSGCQQRGRSERNEVSREDLTPSCDDKGEHR